MLKILQQGEEGGPDDPPRLLVIAGVPEGQLEPVLLEVPEAARDEPVAAALDHLRHEQRRVVQDPRHRRFRQDVRHADD